MRFLAATAALGLAVSGWSSALAAKTLSEAQVAQWDFERRAFTCPLGGEPFRQAVSHPHLPLESFPDGSHPGDEWIDQIIPECPGNGLLILPDYTATPEGQSEPAYYTYSAADLERLPGLVASADWLALERQTRTLRAYWLATRLGRPAADRWRLLLHASWGAENADQRSTALEWLVRDGPGLIAEAFADRDADGMWAGERIINATRELGRFDEAMAMLGGELPQAHDADVWEEADDPMRLAVTARDDDRFAIDLLSDDMAGRVCNLADYARYRGPNAAERCAARDERDRVREAVFQEALVLGRDTATLDAQCAAVSAPDRRPALRQACSFRQSGLTQAEGERLLVEETDRVAEACWAGSGLDDSMTAMATACNRYRNAIGAVMLHVLVRDSRAYEVLCQQQPVSYEENDQVSLACTRAQDTLAEIGAQELWKDLPALRRFCKRTELEQRDRAGIVACVWTEFHDAENPPEAYAREYRDGPMFYDSLTEHAVPYARKLAEKLIADRGGR